jgi:hypothetical protein
MISTKLIGSAAALALVAALSAPTASLAFPHGGHAMGAHPMGGGMGGRVAGGAWGGGGWRGGGWHGGGFWPGAVAGAVVGGALADSYAYYGGPDYYYGPGYDNGYYDNGYYGDGAEVAVVPGGAGGDASYCAQRYRSYDPASGTFLGYDGQRHPCP